jgi:serine/threonine-protein kinase RsbW
MRQDSHISFRENTASRRPEAALYSKRILSNPGQGQSICDHIEASMQAAGFSERERFAVELSISEAICNAARHGNRNDPTKHIDIAYTVDTRRVWVRIADQGEGFAPARVPDPTTAQNLRRCSGRGLLIMRKFMDLVEFNARGNIVTMVKFRSND